MTEQTYLVLEDGSVFAGTAAGAGQWGYGEVVFNTSMTGYQEILTDPSYAGQIVVMTYPLLGNYGTSEIDVESAKLQAAGLVMREECEQPSHRGSRSLLREYLEQAGVPAIAGVDTRALTRRLRSGGVLMGAIASGQTPEQILSRLRDLPSYGSVDFVRQVSTPQPYEWPLGQKERSILRQAQDERNTSSPLMRNTGSPLMVSLSNHARDQADVRGRIAIVDTGLKYNIARVLAERGYQARVFPSSASVDEILSCEPAGVLFSPGPGDPVHLDNLVQTASVLVRRLPVMGICLGHQVLGRAFGAKTFKLKFGHHGANHPVKDLLTGAVHITSQNHGYAIDPDGLRDGAEPSHINLNDGTCEGLRHRDLPVVSIQYHSEGAPGPRDNMYLFDRFLDYVADAKRS